MPTASPRHVLWRQAYAVERYMRSISDQELDLRFADVFTNVTILTDDGKIGIAGLEWLEKLTHIQEELTIRRRDLPHSSVLGSRLATPAPGVQLLGRSIRRLLPDGVPKTFTLFRYGEAKHLAPLLEEGELLLKPASAYNDPSLNIARADDERYFETIDGNFRTRYHLKRDFYCFCTAWLHRDRLISDFGADAVLVINDPHEFFTRLATALDRRDFDVRFNKVTYVDPLLVGKAKLAGFPFVKHMRFAYQVEHRFVAIPPSNEVKIEPTTIHLGSLRDIAVLHGA